MKKIVVVCTMLALLCGCAGQREFETVMDILPVADLKPAGTVRVALPEDAIVAVFESLDEGKLYLCENYEISVQVLEGGDLARTVQEITGFSKDRLTLMETEHNGLHRYDCVWSAMGETEDRIGKTSILDDGVWHYVLSVMSDASKAERLQETWQELFQSFTVVSTAP